VRALRFSRRSVGIAVAVLALVLATLAAAFTVTAVKVSGVSMEPTLHTGDRVLLRPFSGGDLPNRFDVVVTRFATGPTVIKRVIGLPGDGVRIDVSGTGVTVTVQPGGTGPWLSVDNPAWTGRWGTTPLRCCRADGQAGGQTGPQTVPPGTLFLLGDNPAQSRDSRSYGWAPVERIDGVVRWRLRALIVPRGFGSDVRLPAS
jgi:signal peptidase I